MGKRNLNRLFTGIILAGVLGISCPEMEQLAIVTAQAETNAQEGTTPLDKNTVTTAPLQSSATWKKKGGKRYCYRNGRKLTGFQQIDGAWYYFNSKGVMCTGCHKEYIWQTDTMTGNNWSKVPTTLIEMGYMSNPTEDRKMQTKAYQKKMVKGMAEGIKAYFLG